MRAGSKVFLEAMKKAEPGIREVPEELFNMLCEDLRQDDNCKVMYAAHYQRYARDQPGYRIKPEHILLYGSRIYRSDHFEKLGIGHSKHEIYHIPKMVRK